ncbi:MAG: hypothetical protein ACFE8L_02990 [Candidatus Hodarchaeota archaeon]
MKKTRIFNLEKIKELTSPIEEVQSEINHINEISKIIIQNKQFLIKQSSNDVFLEQIEDITNLLNNLNTKLITISNNNIKKFLEFQDNLIKKYKELFKENLRKLKINQENTKKIGLFLIENKTISLVIDKPSLITSVELNQWLELIDSLKQNSIFLDVINKVNSFYNDFIQKKLKIELSKIPNDTETLLIEEFERVFRENPNLNFKEFLKETKTQLTKQELIAKEEVIKKAREKEELEKLKKKQEEQKKTYEEYFKYSDTEFERRRRKKKREKLSDIALEVEKKKPLEISDEVSEKINKFKSKFEKRFKDEYMIEKDDEQDPLDLIRERKKRKEKEYKKFKDHFEKK